MSNLELDWKINRAWIDKTSGSITSVEFMITLTDPDLPDVSTVSGGTTPIAPLPADATKQQIVDGVIAHLGPQMDDILGFSAQNLQWLYSQASATPAPVFDGIVQPTEGMINEERSRRIAKGARLIIPGYGEIAMQGRPEDQTNLNARATAASLKLSAGDTSTMIFRDADNIDHELTPQQQIAVFVIGSSWVESQYKASWTLKEMTPIPMDYTDDKWWQ
jgi:hypothetical protein